MIFFSFTLRPRCFRIHPELCQMCLAVALGVGLRWRSAGCFVTNCKDLTLIFFSKTQDMILSGFAFSMQDCL